MRRSPALLNGICELTLEAREPAELERFYREILGCEVLSREDDRIWLSCGERTRLGLWTRGPKEFGDRGGSHVHFAFSVPSGGLDRLRERLDAHDVEHEGPVEHDGGDRSVYFKDPEGNVVEVWDFFAREPDGVDALAD
jgi:catechol-2,3-dioxygenase